MKVEYINPFIQSTHELFSTMLSSKVERGKAGVTTSKKNPYDITAMIGVSGYARGMVSLSFPKATALQMCGRMLGMEMAEMDDTVSDAVAEMVNIVAGGAKAKFPQKDGRPLALSLPTVIRGSNYEVDYPSDSTWLEVPFTSDLGEFSMRVTFEMDGE